MRWLCWLVGHRWDQSVLITWPPSDKFLPNVEDVRTCDRCLTRERRAAGIPGSFWSKR